MAKVDAWGFATGGPWMPSVQFTAGASGTVDSIGLYLSQSTSASLTVLYQLWDTTPALIDSSLGSRQSTWLCLSFEFGNLHHEWRAPVRRFFFGGCNPIVGFNLLHFTVRDEWIRELEHVG